MTIQAVFSDLDGTLLNSEHVITPLTAQAIRRLGERGIPFVPISGRGPSGIAPVLRDHGLVCPMVGYSGALAVDEQRRVLFHRYMPQEEAAAVIGHLESRAFDVTWCICSYDRWIVHERNQRIRHEEDILRIEAEPGGMAALGDGEPVHKLLLICRPDQIAAVEADLKGAFPAYSIMPSATYLLEVMPGGVTKALAVTELCRLWGIDPQNVLAFGDHYNDLEMMRAAGLGVAMGNAVPEVRAAAGRVAPDNDHEGIYHTLKELGLL